MADAETRDNAGILEAQATPGSQWNEVVVQFLRTKCIRFWQFICWTCSLQPSKSPVQTKQIEDWPNGCPRFAALVSTHPSFHICRRFMILRARVLLLKQDRISILENKLKQLDENETCEIFLTSSRDDANRNRQQLFAELDSALADYDKQVKRNHQMLKHRPASQRAVTNLTNWVEGTASLARDETAYLGSKEDLLCANAPADDALSQLEEFIETVIVRLSRTYRKATHFDISRDDNVWIWSGGLLVKIARTVAVYLISALLVVPVVIISAVNGIMLRIGIIFTATSTFILVLSGFTKARTGDIFVAGATYMTVLVVFVAGNGMSS